MIARTYEGVKWFKMENGHDWIASIPGSNLSVIRGPRGKDGLIKAVLHWFDGEEWRLCLHIDFGPFKWRGVALPWRSVQHSSVRVISQHVQVLRSCFSRGVVQ